MRVPLPRITFLKVIACSFLAVLAMGAANQIDMRCRVVVPKEFRKTSLTRPPNGESEAKRYTVAYEAFWWNCVAVRAADLHGRCPFMASGTPAASSGARDGATDADSQVDRLLKTQLRAEVQKYLRSMASTSAVRAKMRPYFVKPTAEHLN